MADNDEQDGKERKERVIHTRVPGSLDEEIRKRAASLGISVSNLVRNVLRNAFDLVEDVVADSASVARSARGDGVVEEEDGSSSPRIFGWQTIVLDVNAICARCNEVLFRGAPASVAVCDRPMPNPTFLCDSCVTTLTKANKEEGEEP